MKTEIVNKIIAKEQELTLEYLNECKPYLPEESIAILESYNSNIGALCEKYHDDIFDIYSKIITTKKIDLDGLIDLSIKLIKDFNANVDTSEMPLDLIKNYVSKVGSGILFKIIEKSVVDNIIEAYEKEDVDMLYSLKDFLGIDIKDIIPIIEEL